MFQRKGYKEKQLRYSIRKVSFGAASVAIASLYLFMGSSVVSASEVQPVNGEQNSVTNPTAKDNEDKSRIEKNGTTTKEVNSTVVTLDKTSLTKLIEEIDGKFTNGKYASKTEDSVNQLKAALEEAKTALSTAKTQSELTSAHAKLIVATTKLQTKQEAKKQAPAVDTTNGKATVGIKATNTEKAAEINSIANSGSRDERHGKALDRSNPFRTDANTANTDPAANQTYTAPADNADLNTLVKNLLALDPTVENNTKLSQNMDSLGDSKQVAKGTVKEIKEFGGWTAVDGGVFAIARRTEEGVYPLETINSTLNDTVWLQEQAFDRDTEYTLLLSKSRTRSNRDEVAYDNSTYKPTGEGGGITKNLARYKGIEKTFTAYSTKEGSDVIVKFKPGYVGDSEGKKARYKVEVYSIEGTTETKVYETVFDPSKNINDDKQIVTAAKDGTNKAKIKISDANNNVLRDRDTGVDITERPNFIGKEAAEKLMAQPGNKPNGTAGTFTSKPIELPKGADHYKVRVSLADQDKTGMSYQAWDDKYSVPVTGADFSIAQDTSRVAKSLLQRVYDKLLATVDADKRGKTPETQAAYQAQLDAIKEALKPENLTSTKKYQDLLKLALETQSGLKVDKSALEVSKGELDKLVDDDPTPGKTPETVKVYNDALNAAKAEVDKANTVIGNDSATVDQVAQAVADVKAAKAELKAAEAKLVVAATEEQKTKLKNDSDALKPADTNGKTPKSIEAYNTQYRQLEDAINKAKEQAKKVLDKEVNAGKVEATDAQIEVDKIKAELDKAAALLKDKGDTAGLETAKNELKTATEETNVTDGKTKDSADKYNEAKKAAEAVIKEAETVIADVNSTTEDVANALTKVNAAKAALDDAKSKLVEAATQAEKEKLAKDAAALTKADTSGKTPASIAEYEKKYDEFKAELEAAQKAAQVVAEKGENASALDALKAQEKVNDVKDKLAEAAKLLKDKANKEALINAKTALESLKNEETPTGKTADSLDTYTTAKKAAEDEIAAAQKILADENATQEQVDTALAKINAKKEALETAKDKLVDAASQEQKDDLAKAEEKLKLADTTGKTAESIKAYNEAVEKLKSDIEAAKKAAKDLLAKGDNAGELEAFRVQAKINALKEKLAEASKLLESVDKAEAKKAIEEAAKNATNGIDANPDLTDAEKAAEKAKVAEEAKKAIDAIDKATTAEAVTKAKEDGKAAIEKAAAKAEIEAAKAAKEKAIDANPDLTPEQKTAAKAKVAEEATKAIAEIDKATTAEAVTKAKEDGKAAIEKAAAKAEIEAAKAAKEKAIDANPDLTPEQKTAAKAKVAEEATKAIAEIDKATTAEAVTKAKEDGKAAIEKAAAKAEIEAAKAAKEKAIDARTDLTEEEKEAAKKAASEEAEAAKNAIDKATTSEDINKVLEDGKENIANINPVGAKEEAKKAVEEALANKEKEIDARTDLTSEEKVKEKELAREEAKAAKDAIDKATSIEGIEKALRPFLYQIDQDALVLDRPAFDIDAYIQVSVTGIVMAERGNAITQADIIAKLNISENVTVISIDLPDTTTVGRKFAKVTLRLADGTEATVFVPVEVVESSEENHQQNNTQVEDSKPAVVSSDNSEQPAVNQTEDGKENPSNTSQESKASNQKVLPNTGTGNEISIFGSAAMTVLASLGLVATSKKKEEE